MTEEEFRKELAKAERGNGVLQAALGGQLMYGMGVPVDYALAHRLLQMAYAQGVLSATASLGMMYLQGWGVERDLQRAVDFLHEAAERGHWLSLIDLARLHRDGVDDYVPDPIRAAAYYARAVDSAEEAGWEDSDEVEEAKAWLANQGP
jgi:TPR repeat protein